MPPKLEDLYIPCANPKCDKMFIPLRKSNLYHSVKCGRSHNNDKRKALIINKPRPCALCQEIFTPANDRTRRCDACRKAKRPLHDVKQKNNMVDRTIDPYFLVRGLISDSSTGSAISNEA